MIRRDPGVGGASVAAARQSLAEVYERELPTVYGFLAVRAGSAAAAEDLAAEVFVSAAGHFAKGRGHEVTTPWLLTVARRRLVDHWRRSESQRSRIERLWRQRTVPHIDLEADDDRVLRALESLSARQRAALTLRYLDDLAVNEVAEALGTSYQATESLLARARRSFEAAYDAQPEDGR